MGQAIAQTFAKLGCTNIALIDIDPEGLEATAKLLHDSPSQTMAHIHTQQCDISNAESVATAFAAIFNNFKRIDYLVNAAGIMVFNEPSTETSYRVLRPRPLNQLPRSLALLTPSPKDHDKATPRLRSLPRGRHRSRPSPTRQHRQYLLRA